MNSTSTSFVKQTVVSAAIIFASIGVEANPTLKSGTEGNLVSKELTSRTTMKMSTTSSDLLNFDSAHVAKPWVPKTALGRALATKRAAAIAAGMTLLSLEDIIEELNQSRSRT